MYYIAVEGADGSGKTTFIKNELIPALESNIQKLDIPIKIITITEPLLFEKEIKSILNSTMKELAEDLVHNETLQRLTSILFSMCGILDLLMVGRYKKLIHLLKLQEKTNNIIVSDRCILSSWVYQYALIKSIMENKCSNSWYRPTPLETIILDDIHKRITYFCNSQSRMPNEIFVLKSKFKKESKEFVDTNEMILSKIETLYANTEGYKHLLDDTQLNIINGTHDIDNICLTMVNKILSKNNKNI